MIAIDPHTVEPETKMCSVCKEELPLYLFSVDSFGKWGRAAQCKPCRAHTARKKRKEYPEKEAAAKRKYAATPKGHRVFRRHSLLRSYGITEADYSALETEQNNCCGICGEHKDVGLRYLCIDHDHTTGQVRGLLCTKCNVALGGFRDRIDTLEAAIVYLKRSRHAHQSH